MTIELIAMIQTLHEQVLAGAVSREALAASAPFWELAERYVYGIFWRRHKNFIRDHARNLDAGDLMSVALLALLDGIATYEPQRRRSDAHPPTLLSFLTLKMYQACHKEVRNNYERESWNVSAPSKVQIISVDEDKPAEAKVAEREALLLDPATELERRLILDAVRNLPPLYRRIVRLHHFEGHSFSEIGALLSAAAPVNKGTVKRHYDRALACLRPELEALGLGG